MTDTSPFVVFALVKNRRVDHVERYVARLAEVRHQTLESLKKYHKHIVSGIIDGYRSLHVNNWASNRTLIALEQLLVSAALLKIDACPMEGFDRRPFDEMLGPRGLSAVVCCTMGLLARKRQVRASCQGGFEVKDVIEHV